VRVTFLGTGTSQGVPVIGCQCEVCQSLDFRDKRLRTSALLEVKDKVFVFDTGPDFRQQMLRENVNKLDAVIFTHEHKDHTAGLDDVRAFNFRQRKDMPIYGRAQVLDQLKQEFSYAFAEKKYPGVPQLETHELTGDPFTVDDVTFTPIDVMHLKLPVYGFRIGDFTYITDANSIAEEQKEKIKGSKVLVLNALQKQPHISHFNLEEAVEMAQELNADQTYFLHISHKMGTHKSVQAQLPDNIHLAFDGLSIDI